MKKLYNQHKIHIVIHGEHFQTIVYVFNCSYWSIIDFKLFPKYTWISPSCWIQYPSNLLNTHCGVCIGSKHTNTSSLYIYIIHVYIVLLTCNQRIPLGSLTSFASIALIHQYEISTDSHGSYSFIYSWLQICVDWKSKESARSSVDVSCIPRRRLKSRVELYITI